MANTAWNPSDKVAAVTLTNSNLTATTTGGNAGVRAVDKQASGKFYWEATATTFAQGFSSIGIMSAAANLTLWWANAGALGTCGVAHNGNVYVDGGTGSPNPAFGNIASGAVICIALDITAKLIWFRLGSGGNWNNSGTANPATGAGGISTGSIGGAFAGYPGFYGDGSGEVVTANFGDTAFTGTPPSGFTSGFTAGAAAGTNAIATQTSLEHWLAVNPDAQVTQVALEHWATVSSGAVQAIVTQVAIEHWASVDAPIVPGGAAQVYAMVLA